MIGLFDQNCARTNKNLPSDNFSVRGINLRVKSAPSPPMLTFRDASPAPHRHV